ncbi:MAG TPA: VOC family protein [Candidatus Dormibacteraeota bacterium]|nr:VOC family protein [Candidatus Dormibacteraeota bacterium]
MAEPAPTIDHVLVAVADLDRAAARLEADLGLIAVVDARVASGTGLGRLVERVADAGGGPLGVALRTGDIAACAVRIGEAVTAGARRAPDGRELHWRTTGMGGFTGPERLPFFIEWTPGSPHPAAGPAGGPAPTATLGWIELGGEAGRLRAWMGGWPPGIRTVGDQPGPGAVGIEVAGREVVLR